MEYTTGGCANAAAQSNMAQHAHKSHAVCDLSQITREELVLSLRKQSKGFQRASSQFRGVTHHQKGKWEARIGQVRGLLSVESLLSCSYRASCTAHQDCRACTWHRADGSHLANVCPLNADGWAQVQILGALRHR